MAITPTGKPGWVRTNSHEHYGGDTNKKNYQSQGAVNSRTDLTAENVCRVAADIAAMARTAEFATIVFTCNDSVPAAPTVNEYLAQTGGAPTGSRIGDGDVTLEWLDQYSNDYGVIGDLHI